MKILAYVHPARTIPPVSGVGRHVNNMLCGLASCNNVRVELLHASGQRFILQGNASPLIGLSKREIPISERLLERSWKLVGQPRIESYLKGSDVLYSPAETVFPRSSIPSFITLHDIYPLDPLFPDFDRSPRWYSQRRRWERWVPKVFKGSTAVLTVSEFCKQRMLELLDTGRTPVHVVGNGVSPIFFEASSLVPKQCARPGDWPFVLIVGGLTSRKGAQQTLNVARLLRDRRSDLRLVVVGNSENNWARYASEYPNVVLVGPQPDEILVQYMRTAICLLFLSQYEGFGIPAVEAMACRIPAIVANRASLPEVVGDGALVVEGEDPEEVLNSIELVANPNKLRQQLIARGVERAKNFTWTACVNRLLAVFHESCSQTL